MARKKSLLLPSRDPLPHSLRLPSTNPALFKTLSKLTRRSLISLAIQWCSPALQDTCSPYLNTDYEPDDPELPYIAATSLDDLREQYTEELGSAARRGTKREIIDRILEGDWRDGLSLEQIAMADCAALSDHPTSHRWTAHHISRVRSRSHTEGGARSKEPSLPHVHAASLVLALHEQIAALTKAHYYISRPASHAVTIIRIALFDTPYADDSHTLSPELIAASKTVFLAFPDGAPYVYTSLPFNENPKEAGAESGSLARFIIKAIPAALSRPMERYELKSTKLAAKSLDALLAMRGPGRETGVGGGWSIYADEDSNANTLDITAAKPMTTPSEGEDDKENQQNLAQSRKRTFNHKEPTAHLPTAKRTRLRKLARGRFGTVGTEKDKKILDIFEVKIQDSAPGQSGFIPELKIHFHGSNVFAGMRKLVESGVVDASKMPSWMTGEANVSVGHVKDGLMKSWIGEE